MVLSGGKFVRKLCTVDSFSGRRGLFLGGWRTHNASTASMDTGLGYERMLPFLILLIGFLFNKP